MPFGYPIENQVLLETLFQLRVGTGFTQQEIAAKLNIPQSTISKIETGHRKLDLVELKALCDVAGITLTEFVEKFESNLNEKRQ